MTEAGTLAVGQPWDDTREIRKMNVDDVVIDPNVQRTTKDSRLDQMGGWDPDKAEVVTVAERADGTFAVIEGQNRVLKLRRDHPGSKINMVIRPSPATGYAAEEASVARGIAAGRVAHSPFAKMELDLKAGDQYWIAAVEVLAEQNLVLSDTGASGPRRIVAVGTVRNLIHSFDGVSDIPVQEGANLLSRTVSVILTAFGEQPKMWDRVMLQAVAGLLDRGADARRLTVKLAGQSAADWLSDVNRRRHKSGAVVYLAGLIIQEYNRALRNGKLEW